MKCKLLSLIVLACICLTTAALAQNNELAVTAGGYFPFNTPTDPAFAIGGSYARRIFSVPFVALSLELPVYGTINSTSDISTSPIRIKYSAFFLTPGLRVKVAPGFPISPYFVAGGGLAHFSKTNVTTEETTNTGTFDVGAGLDFKVAPYLGFRFEARDYYSGNAKILQGFSDRQHQIVATGGIVLRF
jgi:opacity protein-like surface antigen